MLAAGTVAELAAPGPAGLLTAADYAVGVGFAVTGAWLWAAERGLGLLSLATAATAVITAALARPSAGSGSKIAR